MSEDPRAVQAPAQAAARPYGTGIYRRRILLESAASAVRADLEDDFHRFHVSLHHDGRAVTDLRAESRRHPWTTCPEAVRELEALRGLPLSGSLSAVRERIDPRAGCTHLIELAEVAIRHAAAGRTRRRYDIAVHDRIEGLGRAQLDRDKVRVLDWQLDGDRIAASAPFDGRQPHAPEFLQFIRSELDPELAEAALLLRRCCTIAIARAHPLAGSDRASSYLSAFTRATCYAFQPGNAERGRRTGHAPRDFTAAPDKLLVELLGSRSEPRPG